MKLNSRQFLAFAALLGLAAMETANATNGMWMIGYGAKGTGMGGAGVAYPQDGLAAAYNPASMTELGESRLDADLEIFHPPRAVTHNSSLFPTDERSKNDWFPIPAVGAVLSSPGAPFAMGMGIVGAGLGTWYNQNEGSFFRAAGLKGYKEVGVFLMQMQMLPSIAFKLDENNSIGASLVIAMQQFRAWGLESFADLNYTTNPDNLTNRGTDWSFGGGYRLGWFGTYFDKKLNLGVNFAPKVHMQRFHLYSGLFARRGEFDIPPSYTVGFAVKATPKVTVAFDREYISWSKVPSIANDGPLASDPAQFYPLCPIGTNNFDCKTGGEKGLGFGWRDQTVYKLGVDYKYNPRLTLRAGVNYAKSPIQPSQVLFNMLAPATVEKHITFGSTYTLANKDELTFTFMHAFKRTIRGPTAFPPAGYSIVQGDNAAISMSQTSLSVGYGLKF